MDQQREIDLHRYARQIVLPSIGVEGQRQLSRTRVAIVGTGGLGSPAALYLAAAGVGTIGLIDFDEVDTTNLHRQILHSDDERGARKTRSGARRLESLNPDVRVIEHDLRLDSSNALDVFTHYDMILDGSDNFATRYLVNDACVILGKPDVYGSIFRFEGQASIFATPQGPCYRCLYPEPPPPGTIPDCAEAGVLGVLPGVIGTIQATEAIKLALNLGEPLVGRLFIYDSLRMETRTIRLKKNRNCVVCGDDATQKSLIDYERFCGTTKTERGERVEQIDVREVKRRLDEGDEQIVILDVREPHELAIASIEGTLNIPMGEIRQRLEDLDRDKEYLVLCRTGKRSMMAAVFLEQNGLRAKNVEGGMHAWSDEVDPSQPKY